MRKPALILSLGMILFVSGCASSHYQQGRRLAKDGDHDEAVKMFYQEIDIHPDSGRAWRELGVSFYDQGDYSRAEEALKQSAAIKSDARTHLYLGLTYEQEGDPDRALHAYRMALGLDPGGKTRDLLESRVHVLVNRKVMDEVRVALDSEQDLTPSDIPENTVAVVEFDSSELPPELAPLAKGMAEFTAQDLSKVGSLQVVDRLKIEALKKELALSQSEIADPATAPRIGRLVGGRRIVTGTMLGLGDESFRLSGAVVNTSDETVDTPDYADGKLTEFFKVQKKFVFDVIASMDITLTPEERTAIEEIPTENYLAFMAYCRGLTYRDQNQMAEARVQFQSASSMDRGFSQASGQEKSISSMLSAGVDGNLSQFGARATTESDLDLTDAELSTFQSTVMSWNGFVPTSVDLNTIGEFVDTPPRTSFQGDNLVTIRGNLDVRP